MDANDLKQAFERLGHGELDPFVEKLHDDVVLEFPGTRFGGRFEGKRKEYNPKGFVKDDGSNAIWGMRFIWPIKADYRIVYLTDDYSVTVIGRNKRDFVWVMARTPSIPENEYESIVELIGEMGYDVSKLEKVPQRW